MPIVSQTFEEKVELLKQDTRECIDRVELEYLEWSIGRTGDPQYAEAVQFLRLRARKSFSAAEVVDGLTKDALGRGGINLLNEAILAYDAQQIVKRWEELPTRGQNGPELDKWE